MTRINKKGFTLIELIVVISIIAILAAILLPSLIAYLDKVRIREADSNVKDIYSSATAAYAQQKSIGKETDGITIENIVVEQLGSEYDPNDIEIVTSNNSGVTTVSWCDGRYWALYVSNGSKLTHGKGPAVGQGAVNY